MHNGGDASDCVTVIVHRAGCRSVFLAFDFYLLPSPLSLKFGIDIQW